MTQRYCYLNGEILPFENASIGINDLGLLRGYSAFDYMRTYNGRPFRLKDHMARFRNSAATLLLPVTLSDEKISGIIDELLSRSNMVDAGIRFILTGGYSPDA
ncbi:MAG TPA: aminotransferase class IV, partial [Flavobacterium sp.]|nr:aminotransferase class IV [Flavobacterium sp.]